jgi:predicted NAD/FAD-binding protein
LTLIRFFDNHGLLTLNGHPTWKVVAKGSHTYIPLLTAPLAERIHVAAAPTCIARGPDGVTLRFADREPRQFDDVVLACHGDQVLPLLRNPSDAEADVFRAFTTSANSAWLHTDVSVLPAHERAWASWNYLLAPDPLARPTVTYDLNRLQGLATRERYLVTLNPSVPIDAARVIGRFVSAHPLYTLEAIRAQARWADVSGVDRIHYCGAYWGHGFHEDGFTSAIRVARTLGVAW